MKRLLLVDDDAVVTRVYRDRLSAHGFHVNTAESGATALCLLRSAKPDLVVLDLMMPEVTGVDVLKFIRGQPRLEATPVVVLANALENDLGRHAGRIGIQKAFLKAQCSPSVLMAAVDEILEPGLAAARPAEPVTAPATSLDAPPAKAAVTAASDPTAQVGTEEPRVQAGASLRADAPAICAHLGALFEALAREPRGGPEEQDHLQDLFCKVHFLAEAAGQTEFAVLAQATAVFDGLLNVVMEHPERLGPSVLRTVGSLVGVVGLLFQQAHESRLGTPLGARVLVVDDDPAANQMVVAALRQAQLNAHSTEDSLVAWQWINREHFDLVLLGMEMPVLDGFQLCERLRRVPGYEKTPVIVLAAHDDVNARETSTPSGADDLIAKPVLPQEVAARVVMHLVRTQIRVQEPLLRRCDAL
jgi:DNA-binding response OmpR family regulator